MPATLNASGPNAAPKRWKVLALVLTALLGLTGLVARYALYRNWHQALAIFQPNNWSEQVLWGGAVGLSIALLLGLILRHPYFRPVEEFFLPKLTPFMEPRWYPWLLSLFAGVFEELFFRAFLQEALGLLPAAILFVLVHGYYRLRPQGMPIVALFLTGFSLLLGLLYQHLGFYAAAAAHFIYDLTVLEITRRQRKNQ